MNHPRTGENAKALDRNAFRFTYQRGKLQRAFREYIAASIPSSPDLESLPARQRLALEDAFYAGSVLVFSKLVDADHLTESQMINQLEEMREELDQFGLSIADRYQVAGLD